jgi:hypothetical protein
VEDHNDKQAVTPVPPEEPAPGTSSVEPSSAQSSAPVCEPAVPAAQAIQPKKPGFSVLAPAIAIIAWFVPGLGHLLLGRWGRALAIFIAVGGLATGGYLMRGNVFPPHSEDPFGTLGFIADASSGVFYLLSRVVEASGPDVSRAIGDYGTRFIAGAGILNVLAICDAYEIALGRRR